MKKYVVIPMVIGGSLLCSGCSTLELVSFGASGISYLVSGKSLSDHAISAVMDQDCALHRAVLDEAVCVDHVGDGLDKQIPKNLHDRYWQDIPINRRTAIAANSLKQPIDKPGMTKPNSINITTISAQNSDYLAKPQLFAVLGSFNQLEFAKRAANEFNGFPAQVVANANGNAGTRYRVIAGPFSEAEYAGKISNQYSAWRISLCAHSMTPPPCGDGMLAKAN